MKTLKLRDMLYWTMNHLKSEVNSMLMIYGKHKTDKRFSPMDMNMGQPVKNKIYATMYEDSDKSRLTKSLEQLHNDNPDWKFELRKT